MEEPYNPTHTVRYRKKTKHTQHTYMKPNTTPTHSVFPVPPGIFNGTHVATVYHPLKPGQGNLATQMTTFNSSTQCYSMLFQWNETKQLQEKVLT
jgi:hypothetical protein